MKILTTLLTLIFLASHNAASSSDIMEESNQESQRFFDSIKYRLEQAKNAESEESQKLLTDLNQTFAGPGTRKATKQDWEAFHLLCSLNARLLKNTNKTVRSNLLNSLFTYENNVDPEKMRVIHGVSYAIFSETIIKENMNKNPLAEFIKALSQNMDEYSKKQRESFEFFQKYFTLVKDNQNQLTTITISGKGNGLRMKDAFQAIKSFNTLNSTESESTVYVTCGGRKISIIKTDAHTT